MKLLVTGTGRCGTWWLTHALRSTGVAADHEKAFSVHRHGEGPWACEVSWLAAPFTPRSDAHVVHLVRHPLATIASRAAWGSFSDEPPSRVYDPRPKGRWAISMCPEIAEGSTPVERAAIHWARWNEMIVADEQIRLEDVTAGDVWRFACLVSPKARWPTLGSPANRARNVQPVGWGDVEHVPGLVDQARRFGYL